MKNRTTNILTFFALLLIWITGQNFYALKNLTESTIRTDITGSSSGGPKTCNGCHEATGANIDLGLEFPSEIVPGRVYEVVGRSSVVFTDMARNVRPGLQTTIYSKTDGVSVGWFLAPQNCDAETEDSAFCEKRFILFSINRGSAKQIPLGQKSDYEYSFLWQAAANLPVDSICCNLGSMYKITNCTAPNDSIAMKTCSWGCATILTKKAKVVRTVLPEIQLANPQNLMPIPAGSTTWFEFDVKNTTAVASTLPWSVHCFLSSDANLSQNDQLVGEIGQQDLPQAGRDRVEGAFTIGSNQPAGAYFLILQADRNNVVAEMNDFNNTLAVPITITSGNDFCASKSLYNTNEYIKSVKLGSIDASSIAGFYSEKLYLDRHFKKGVAQPVTITGDFSGSFTATEYVRIWADLNLDNQFSANEVVFSKTMSKPIAASATKAVSGNLTIPTTAKSGYMRLRVSMQRGAWPPACGNLTLGEVEDFVVKVVDELKPGDRQAEAVLSENAPTFNLAPNPAIEGTTVDLSAFFGKKMDISVFDLNGKQVFQQDLAENAVPYLTLETGDWQPGIFMVFVNAEGLRPVARKLAVVNR